MKRMSAIFFGFLSAAAVSYGGSPFVFSGSSSEFVVDTRPDVAIDDVTSAYCSGVYGGHGGTRQTFISGVRCNIEFAIHASGRDNNPIDHYIVNGQRQDSATFTFNVGSLSPGDHLTVIAVAGNEKKSKPFRVNLEIATAPPMWASAAYLTQIVAEPDPAKHRVVYRAPEYRGFCIFDAMSDIAEVGSPEYPIEMPLELNPILKLWQSADSSTGQYCEGADTGLSGGSYNKRGDTIGRFGGSNITVGLTGGAVYQYNPLRTSWLMNSAELGVHYDFSWKVRQRIPEFPLVYVEIGFLSTGSFVMRERNGDWSTDISLKPFLAGKATAGIGVDVLAQAEVSGQIGLNLEAHVPGGLESVILNGQVSWRVVLIGFEWTGIWWDGNLYLYPPCGPGVSAKALFSHGLHDADSAEKGGGFTPIPRNYGDGLAAAVRFASGRTVLLSASGADNTIILIHDGYPTPQPAIAIAGTSAALVYVRDNAARSDLDRTEIVFREEALDGSWGGETHVWDDGTCDFQPKLAILPDGTAIAAWANAKRSFADGTSFETVCASLESAVGVRDPQSGTWTCANLTDDAALDWVPVLKGATNGTAAVAWVRNAAGAYIGTAARPSDLAVSFYRNGSWSPMTIAVGGVGAVLSHDIAWDGDRAVLVWAADPDGDLTTDDSEVWAKSFENGSWSAPVRLSESSAGALRPFVWYMPDGAPHAIWVQAGALFAADGLGAAAGTNVVSTAGFSVPGDYRIFVRENGSATMLWTAVPSDSGGGLDGCVMSADYVPGTGLATPASLLRRERTLLRNLSGSMGADGTLRVAFESVSVSTNAEGRLVQGAVDLAVFRRDAMLDVGVTADDCSFAADVDVGVTNTILVGLQNYGTIASGSFEYRIWTGEGEDKMLLAADQANVAPLSRELVEVPWTPVEGLTNVAFTIELDPENQIGDSNRENNTLTWRPDVGSPLLSLRNAKAVKATDTLRLISARIHNAAVAPLPAGMTVKFWRGEIGGELIGTDTAGLVSGGNAGEYDVGVAWDVSGVAFTSEWERVVIELPAEQGGRSVSVWTPTPLYDPENDIEPGGGGGSGGGSGGGETPSVPPNIGGITGFGEVDGSQCFHIYFHGETGFAYLVQHKERLTDAEWTTILTVTPSATGDFPVAIPIDTSAPSGFYRISAIEK